MRKKNNKGISISRDNYQNRFEICLNKNSETPGPCDYQFKNSIFKESFLNL